MTLDPSSRNRLTPRTAARFTGDTLFDRVARALCTAGRLPRKELYEAWHVARAVHRRMSGGRIVDLCAGHGLLGQLLLLMDRQASHAVAVDRVIPDSAVPVAAALAAAFPALDGRVTRVAAAVDGFALEAGDLVVALHACGGLTDLVLARAAAVRARVAVLPCCHDLATADLGDLAGWLAGPLACDVTRVAWLRARRYQVFTKLIDPQITPQNRLLIGTPLA